jgi:hypothetical protein
VTSQQQATVHAERGGRSFPAQEGLSPVAVARSVTDLEGAQDVILVIVPSGSHERLLVAVDGSKAFLGLERPDGLFQFVHDEAALASRPFTIGGQRSDIEGRYLLDVGVAAAVVEEWLTLGEGSSIGYWERR